MERIQRQRKAGWRTPPKTRYVGRGSQLGNPYRIDLHGTRDEVIFKFFDDLVHDRLPFKYEYLKARLEPYDYISCYCKLDQHCHADVLIYLVDGMKPGLEYIEAMAKEIAWIDEGH